MMRHLILCLLLASTVGCTSTLDTVEVGTATKVAGAKGFSKDRIARDGQFYFAGQPDEGALRAAEKWGIKTVINLRPESELEDSAFDEATLVTSLGMEYVSLPLTPGTFSREHVAQFSRVLADRTGPVLIHCSSSNRVGGLWTVYLILERGMDDERALELGAAAGMSKAKMIESVERVLKE